MGLWEKLPSNLRSNGEHVLWEGRAAVATAALVGASMAPIDTAGVDRGFVVLTDRRLTIGHVTKLRGKPEPWDSFAVAGLQAGGDDPRGVAFLVTAIGPVDIVTVMPSRDLDRLRRAAASLWKGGTP